ncbi:MAG TPA: amidophosphoribosyltransferase [Candidatus Limnocylindrales bacterium]|nr:amidophosphoribosyltransferase [Candidatus Limnocylindrales bacterium]
MREACGVFGIYCRDEEVAQLTYYGLYALQHRGEESAGIAIADGEKVVVEKGMGLVSDVFQNKEKLTKLKGHIACGHVRYSTTSASEIMHAQPLVVRYYGGFLAVSHNGNLTNCKELRDKLEGNGSIFQTTSDSEMIAHLVAISGKKELTSSLKFAAEQLKGGFAFVLMTEKSLIGLRDPWGIRPLSIGALNGGFVLASETCAFDAVGAEFIREVNPGELVVIDEDGLFSEQLVSTSGEKFCIFEFIYFARPDSQHLGKNVHLVRKEFGRILAREHRLTADLVTGVPDSSLSTAPGVAEELNLPYETAFVKNRYVGRTFIQPEQNDRTLGVRLKLNPMNTLVAGKKVIMVDDSIVRGTTSMRIVDKLKKAGATEVYVLISSPRVTHPCFYGIDTASKDLIGAKMDVPAIAKAIGADYLGYLSKEGMLGATGLGKDRFCTACFDGCYPDKANPEQLIRLCGENSKCGAAQSL